ncbi:acetate--CoA ligase family protein [Emcibacter sp. SYSU 3D8]|uniref:acetate--CoA ligase family protein n=1 Tax=Emcibacter sp. SYSU 3D8 TaxID=3133969 RepID=UPI0031FE4D3F
MTGPTTTGTAPRCILKVVRRAYSRGGFGYGLRQEFLKAVIEYAVPQDADWDAVDRMLCAVIPRSGADLPDPAAATIGSRMLHWTAELQRAGGQPVFGHGKVIGVGAGSGALVLACPTVNVAAASEALLIVADLISGAIDGAGAEVAGVARQRIDSFVKFYSTDRLGGSNTPLFLRAAFDSGMPWFRVAGDVFQIGMGSKARWMESSLSDVTPAISMRLARNKIAAAELLRQAGLPVPAHELVQSAAEAVAAAGRLGYPVVVKPADRDGGLAVAAGLTSDAGVSRAYETARKVSQNVLVEKHVEGRDYRLVVHDGRMVWALERVPGGVTGDGISTVEQLVVRLNQEPARAKRADAPLKPLNFDREAAELLAEHGLTLQSVPASGQRIRLRRAANVASGGTPEAAFERVHPDNRRLAERAAAVMRLDIAGVDLLIRDVSRSWKEIGAAICEVNAQPTIGNTTASHLYGQMLKRLVKGDGRIPIAMIVGVDENSALPALVTHILEAAGLRTAIASSRQASVGGRTLHDAPGNLFAAARAALIDPDVDAVVAAVSDASVLSSCLPFDRCSTIVLAGSRLAGVADSPAAFNTLAQLLLPVSLGGVVVDSRQDAWRRVLKSAHNAQILVASAGADPASSTEPDMAGHEAVVLDTSSGGCRLRLDGTTIDLEDLESGDGPRTACAPEDIALAAATGLSMGLGVDVICSGLAAARITVAAVAG